jgi:Uma2 family endonuclease
LRIEHTDIARHHEAGHATDAVPQQIQWLYLFALLRNHADHHLVLTERDPNEELGYLLRIYRDTNPEGRALDFTVAEQTIHATPQRRRADRAIWAGLGRQPDEEADLPEIVVEFVSARKRDAQRDYQTKRDEYLAAGVREYWIIDRFRRTLTVHRQGPEGPVTLVVTEDQDYETPLLPGFVLPLARLLARADAWRKRRRNGPKKGTEP